MAQCEVCGNEYDKSIELIGGSARLVLESIKCAAFIVAPQCCHCDCRILGRVLESSDEFFCYESCATHAGTSALRDRVEAA